MGCGASAPVKTEEEPIVVNGDCFIADTRSVLTVLELGEAVFQHTPPARTNSLDYHAQEKDFAAVAPFNGPVLQQGPLKVFGAGYQIVEGCCFKDKRNATKFDAKKKPIKKPKGWTPAPPLNPQYAQNEINSMVAWFNQNFRPHS